MFQFDEDHFSLWQPKNAPRFLGFSKTGPEYRNKMAPANREGHPHRPFTEVPLLAQMSANRPIEASPLIARKDSCWQNVAMFAPFASGVSLGMIAALSPAALAQAPAEALVVVANHVRLQGYKCDKPSAVERDVSLSKPGLPVWLLTCGEGRYRVELIPHKQARVTPLN
jgi:hypothetical protein